MSLDVLLESFDATIDSAEIDPRPRVKAVVAKIIATEYAGGPVDLSARIAKPLLETLGRSCKDVIESGRYEALDGLLSGFRADCRAAVVFEKQSGQLKSWDARDAITPWVGEFSRKKWNGFETSIVQALLQPRCRILKIDFRVIGTTTGEITRAAVHAEAIARRPRWAQTVGSLEEFEKNLTREVAIVEAERSEARLEQRRRTVSAGPQHLIGTLIE